MPCPAHNQTSFLTISKNETISKEKYTVYTRLGEKRTLVGVFDTEQEGLTACLKALQPGNELLSNVVYEKMATYFF